MKRPPRLVTALLRLLLPPEVADAFLGDLEELYRRRARRDGRLRAGVWYVWQVASLPYARLWRAARRLRARRDRWTDQGREEGTMGSVTSRVWQEVRVAARSLARRPLFSGIVVATLASSLGAATLLFSVLEGVLLRPLPYPDPEALVNVHATSEEWRTNDNPMIRRSWDTYQTSLAQLEALSASPAVEALGGSIGERVVLREGGPPEEARVERVTAGVFEALAVEPALGRLPSPDEHAEGARVIVLSHRSWTEHFGADPSAVGRSLDLDDDPHTVVGVMPAGFHYPYEDVAAWTPLTPDLLSEGRRWSLLSAVGRLAPGAEAAEARTELEAINRRLAENDPELEGIGIRVVGHLEEVVGDVRKGLALLSTTVALVLLLACVNLANLLVARSASRRSELAVRSSLGAGRAALLWAVSAEVVLLCIVGGTLGVGLAVGLLGPFVEALEASVRTFPRTAAIRMNPTVIAFAAAAVVLTALGAAIPVGLGASRRAPGDTLRGSGRGVGRADVHRTQRVLLLTETALAVVLLAGAGLLSRSFARTMTVDPGYASAGLVYVDMDPGPDRYADRVELDAYYERLRGHLAAIPGVESGAVTLGVPSGGGGVLTRLRPTGAPEEEGTLVGYTLCDPNFFETLGLPVLRGRTFDGSDRRDAPPVTVLSRSLAERLFGEEDALGRNVTIGEGERATHMEVVGIVGDARMSSIRREPEPHFYRPLAQRSVSARTVLLRVVDDPVPVLEAARRVAGEVDPGVVVEEAGTLDEVFARSFSDVRFRTLLMAALAGLALVLALVGVFGVVAHVVEGQTREIGIRMALGSASGAEIRRVMRGAAAPAFLGAVLGTLVAWRASGVLEGLVEDEILTDPLSYGVAPLLLAAAALLAAWLPARRAARVHPAEVLDGE